MFSTQFHALIRGWNPGEGAISAKKGGERSRDRLLEPRSGEGAFAAKKEGGLEKGWMERENLRRLDMSPCVGGGGERPAVATRSTLTIHSTFAKYQGTHKTRKKERNVYVSQFYLHEDVLFRKLCFRTGRKKNLGLENKEGLLEAVPLFASPFERMSRM